MPFKTIPSRHAYELESKPLNLTDSIKYLGVTIQSNLKFDAHIEGKGKILGGIKNLRYV